MRYCEILNEMISRTSLPPENGNYVLAFNAFIWVLPDDFTSRSKQDASIYKDIRTKTGIPAFKDIHNLRSKCDDRPDLLFGYILKNKLYIFGLNLSHTPSSSPLVKKVVNQLNLDGIELETISNDGNEDIVSFNKNETNDLRVMLHGNIPNIVYHGTCFEFLQDISKTGIRPTINSNWERVGKFHDLIFLTSDITNAIYHANHQMKKYDSIPLVIAIKLPDRNKIVMDYDVAAQYYGSNNQKNPPSYERSLDANPEFRNKQAKIIQKYNPKTDFTKTTGIFAYRGIIPPTFFTGFFTNFSQDEGLTLENEYKFNSFNDLHAAYVNYMHLGFYNPDYDPEEEDYNEDEE